MTTRMEMEMTFLGEILTPSRCGRMDQCCAFGAIPHVMTFDGDLLMTEPIAPPLEPVHLVVVDLGGEKDTLEILNSLNKAYPIAEDELQRGVQRLLGIAPHTLPPILPLRDSDPAT
jgi:galactokinase